MTSVTPASREPDDAGVTFPKSGERRPTTPTGRAILADAGRAVRPELGAAIESARKWRTDYLRLVRELTAASGVSAETSLAIAQAGLASMRSRMVVERDGEDVPLADSLALAEPGHFSSQTITGTAGPVTELRIPYRGGELHGDALLHRLERWVEEGIIEPSAAGAVRRVVEHPEWLRLSGRRVVLVGAAAEIGPLEALTAWGANVVAIDVPTEAVSQRITELASAGAGTVTLPVAPGSEPGADLLRALPEVRAWLDEILGDEDLVLGMYAYADGGMHVRLSAAFDALATDVVAHRPQTALAYLATPTDAYVVPDEVVEAGHTAWNERGLRRLAQAPVRALSAGRLFAPSYAGGDAVADILVKQQGPNYALAKRLQRWRALTAAAAGATVSCNVAPSAWTHSVTKNRVLAAAYAGAQRFGVEIFGPDTCRTLMAALLVHDLHQPPHPDRHPEHLFAEGAAHGGMWRRAYEPRSVLTIAALAGLARPHR